METGDLISFYRKQAGLTIDELSEKSCVPKGTLNKIIAGVTKAPTLDNMKSIARALGKTLEDFDDAPRGARNPTLPADAMKIANDYSALDEHGKHLTRIVIDAESSRMKSEKTATAPTDEHAMDQAKNVIFILHNSEKASAGKGFYLDGHEQMDKWLVELNELTRQADFCVDIQGDSMEPRFADGDTVLVRAQPSVNVGEIGLFAVDGAGYIKRQRADFLESINERYDDIPLDTNMTIKCFGRVIGILEDEWIVEK